MVTIDRRLETYSVYGYPTPPDCKRSSPELPTSLRRSVLTHIADKKPGFLDRLPVVPDKWLVAPLLPVTSPAELNDFTQSLLFPNVLPIRIQASREAHGVLAPTRVTYEETVGKRSEDGQTVFFIEADGEARFRAMRGAFNQRTELVIFPSIIHAKETGEKILEVFAQTKTQPNLETLFSFYPEIVSLGKIR